MDSFDEFLDAIETGMDMELAALSVGASPLAIFRLLERGKAEQARIYATTATAKPDPSEAAALELWVEVCKRRAKAVGKHIRVINRAAEDGDWKASKFILEHLHPNAYSPRGSHNSIEARPLGEIEGY